MKHLVWILTTFCFLTTSVSAQLYHTIDTRAKRASWQDAETPESLVAYLTQNLTTDQDKARAIAAWITFQVERDGYRHFLLVQASNDNRLATAPLSNDTFQTRIGTSYDFANLFQQLAEIAGLESVTIEGFAGRQIRAFRYQDPIYQAAETLYTYWTDKNYQLQRYQAAWNAVKINDKWELVDTYWMIANPDLYAADTVRTNLSMKSFLKRRLNRPPAIRQLTAGKKIDDAYFMAKPRFFARTHFPLESHWQLLRTPLTWASFISQ